MSIRFDGKVAIVTGSGNGLGKSHALNLAARGAKLVINDFGGARDGSGGSLSPSESVVEEIIANGGEAIAHGADVSDSSQINDMVSKTLSKWGRVDVLINNAGILRDRSYAKMSEEEWDSVVAVHLKGSHNCSHAVWGPMREQNYGRILMTTSTSGVFGNFGQTNYGAAKMGVVGMMNTLCIEGAKYNIKVNCLAPTAATRMTEDILNEDMLKAVNPTFVSPAAVYMVSEDGPNRTVILAGAGSYSVLELRESDGIYLPQDKRNADGVAEHFAQISNMDNFHVPLQGNDHIGKIITRYGENNS